MVLVPGYAIDELLYESSNSLVYRALRSQGCLPVVLKILKEDYPSPRELVRYKQEFRITSTLKDRTGIIQAHGLESYQNTLVMILEDFGATSLKILMSRRGFTLTEVLSLGARIASSLKEIHDAHIMHKDINPSNIVYNPETDQLKLIDFGISTMVAREDPVLESPSVLEGTLAYISPEQTGRMNRSVDYRTDFYSLGVTLYEMLTGQLPFDVQDPLELVHCHIARLATPPHVLNERIPRAVSDIVMKLLAKTAEQRYKSGLGIRADLLTCLAQLNERGKISIFPLGMKDPADKLVIPQRLYGREREIELLLAGFDRVSQGNKEMTLISGHSGIGKTALVREIYRPMTRSKGYFIAGKFDQFQRHKPYTAMVDAFRDLTEQLLTESEPQIRKWREELLCALGVNGQVIVDLIPEMELILGPQPEVPDLEPEQRQNRFNFVFLKLVGVLAKSEHPLVLFLDDLQWADAATLKLISLLMTSLEDQSLFLIGAYRDNEVDDAHPLRLTLKEIQQTEATVHQVSLSSLSLADVSLLVADALQTDQETAQRLSELVQAKTDGNPFFIGEFLMKLFSEGLLHLDPRSGGWRWNIVRIQAQGITDNVVDLMAEKIRKFAPETQHVLKLSACIGNHFALETLAMVNEKSPKEALLALQPAVTVGLILPIGHAYKSLELDVPASGEDSSVMYKFAHDRIQQAAYSLIREAERQGVHRRVGQLLLQNTPPDRMEQNIFDIITQFNECLDLIDSQGERDKLAGLNLLATRKAKESAAYEPALRYAMIGRRLIGDEGFERDYALALKLHNEACEAALLNKDFALMEKLTEAVLAHARTVLDKVTAYEVKIKAYSAQGRGPDALRLGKEILGQCGYRLPRTPNKLHAALAMLQAKIALAGRPAEKLLKQGKVTEPRMIATWRIAYRLARTAYMFNEPMLTAVIACTMVAKMARFRQPFASAGITFSSFGSILIGAFGDIEGGYQFGKLAERRLELDMPASKAFRPQATYYINGFIRHWKEHIETTLQPFLEAYRNGLDVGDHESASTAAYFFCYHSFYAGHELTGLAREMAAYHKVMVHLKEETFATSMKLHRQVIVNLQDPTRDPGSLTGEFCSEREILQQEQSSAIRIHLIAMKMYLCFLFGHHQQAIEGAQQLEPLLDKMYGVFRLTRNYCYVALIWLSVFPDLTRPGQRSVLKKVDRTLRKFEKWALHAPMNHLHLHHLLQAERSRVLGQGDGAIKNYERAIKLAKEHGFVQEEALANELAARFFLREGNASIARYYLTEALYAYLKWGAQAKVNSIEEKHGDLLGIRKVDAAAQKNDSFARSATQTTDRVSGTTLDLNSVINASQNISSEIVLSTLLEKLMTIVIRNAGAERGFLIMEAQGELRVEASIGCGGEVPSIGRSRPLAGCADLPESIVRFAYRSKTPVILGDASQEDKFHNDPYVARNRPRSVLCMPILHHGNASGVLYLENNQSTDVFTAARVELLGVLSAQAAISIENAHLYDNLKIAHQELLSANEELRHQVVSRSERLYAALELISRGADAGRARLQPGEIIDDRYRVVREIGHGGMGAVYDVERLSDERHAALKVALRLNALSLSRLAREAKVVAQVAHPNIVTVLDVDVAKEGFLYLVMELVDGTSLDLHKSLFGRLDWALGVLAQVASGLAALHREGVVHRDIKPANIVITGASAPRAPLVKIIDFGISQMEVFPPTRVAAEARGTPEASPPDALELLTMDGESLSSAGDRSPGTLTTVLPATGALSGTPWYMSPELSDGAKMISPAADIFSFGVLSYQLLAGRLPFEHPIIVAAVHHTNLPSPRKLSQLAPDLDENLASIIERCLEVERSLRPSADELALALKRFSP